MEFMPITESEVLEAIKSTLGQFTQFQLTNYEVFPASENPMGFLGDHLRIKAVVVLGYTRFTRTLHFFAKTIPTKVQSHYEYAIETKAFYKEIELFKTFFKDIQNARTAEYLPKFLPNFLYARGNDLFVVEDLAVSGYKMLPERTVLDFDHCKAAMEALARLHAGSFIFEEKYRQGKAVTLSPAIVEKSNATIADLYPNLLFETEASDIKGHPGNTFWEAGIRSQSAVVDLLPGLTDESRKNIKQHLPDALRTCLQFVKPSQRFRNVIIHGDLWSNNIMFSYKDNAVENAVIVDFQLARYGPPAHDLMMFLHVAQTRSFRKEHEKNLLQYYYEVLSNELRSEGLDIEEVLPLKEFEESIDYYREYAILNAVVYFQLIFTPGEINKEFMSSPELFHLNYFVDRSAMVVACYQRDEVCRARIIEGMQEAIEYFKWT